MGKEGREEKKGRGRRGVQGSDFWFTSIFVGDGAAHAGAFCHVCSWWGSNLICPCAKRI